MDLTVLDLALPSLSRTLAPSASELLWILDIYGFSVAGLLISMGNLGDRIGRRRLLLLGAGAFGCFARLPCARRSSRTCWARSLRSAASCSSAAICN